MVDISKAITVMSAIASMLGDSSVGLTGVEASSGLGVDDGVGEGVEGEVFGRVG